MCAKNEWLNCVVNIVILNGYGILKWHFEFKNQIFFSSGEQLSVYSKGQFEHFARIH